MQSIDGEARLRRGEMNGRRQPLTSAQNSQTVTHPRIHARAHFPAQVCSGGDFAGSEGEESGAAETGGVEERRSSVSEFVSRSDRTLW